MASSSSCALRGTTRTRESPFLLNKRGGLCHRRGVNPTLQRPWVMVAQAAAVLVSSSCPVISLAKSQPALKSAAVIYANKMAEEKNCVTPDKLDQWMKESIGDIVRNIGNAQFLMSLFSVSGRAPSVRAERETASPENWPRIKKKWGQECRTPDAVILVEELENAQEDWEKTSITASTAGGPAAGKTWGLVVQGRGMDCAACYILNTTRVKSSMGFCTHFCLVRARCFGESAEVQLRNAWLQGR